MAAQHRNPRARVRSGWSDVRHKVYTESGSRGWARELRAMEAKQQLSEEVTPGFIVHVECRTSTNIPRQTDLPSSRRRVRDGGSGDVTEAI